MDNDCIFLLATRVVLRDDVHWLKQVVDILQPAGVSVCRVCLVSSPVSSTLMESHVKTLAQNSAL